MNTCLILLMAISGAVGQGLPCPDSNFTTARNTCAAASIPSLPDIRNLMATINDVYEPSVILNQVAAVCANKEAVKTFMTCLDTASRACVPSEYHKAMQTAQQISAGVDYFCNNIDNIDFSCYINGLKNVLSCITTATSNNGQNRATASGYFNYICLYNSETAKCLKSTYSTCSKPNTGSVLETARRSQIPQACDGVINSVSMILLLAVSLMNLITW